MKARCLWPVAAALLLAGCSSSPAKLRVANLGDRVELGHVIYTVFDTQWLTQVGEGMEAKVPQNRYFLIRLSAANSSTSPILLPPMTLTDDDGHTYNELSDADFAPQWIGGLHEVQTAEAAQGNVVFDVPPRHYRLKVTDENQQQAVLVDIPLSLGSDVQVSPLPEGKK
jgi:hypothetical protein